MNEESDKELKKAIKTELIASVVGTAICGLFTIIILIVLAVGFVELWMN